MHIYICIYIERDIDIYRDIDICPGSRSDRQAASHGKLKAFHGHDLGLGSVEAPSPIVVCCCCCCLLFYVVFLFVF